MATTHGYPKWLLNSKESVSTSKEWNAFLRELHDAVQQQLTESHVQYFSDLSEPEKELFMQRATKALEGGTAFNNMYKRVSLLMDQSLNEEVARQLLEDMPMDTKSDLILDGAEDGALSLLKRYPDMKNKLHVCFNQPLPLTMRQLAWRLYLTNTKVRKTYVDLLQANPRAAISSHDYEISQKSEQLLKAEPTFNDLRGSVGIFYGMKAVLSYYHSTLKTQARLRDVDHMLIVPFMQVSSTNISRRDPPNNRVVALLVEEFFTFMESRPGFVVDSGYDTHNEEMKGFVDKVARLLQHKHPEVAKTIIDKFQPAKEKIVATETGSYSLLIEGLTALIRPMIRTIFVGYLKMETLLYVWDQYIMGLDTPGFNTEWLAAVTATMLGLMRDKLKESSSPTDMEIVMKTESSRLTIPQFQFEIKQYHYQELYAMLVHDQKAAMPVLDPTQALHPPWRHWFNDVMPPYTKPQDRRKAREEREAERERLNQQQKDSEAIRKEREDRERKYHRSNSVSARSLLKSEISRKSKVYIEKDEEEEFLRLAARDKQRIEEERMKLEDTLQEERRQRLLADKKKQDEIDRLKLEVDVLKRQAKSPAPSVYSLSSNISRVLMAPPPSAASRMTYAPSLAPLQEMKTPTQSMSPAEQAEISILDFLKKVSTATNKIAHGQDEENRILDQQTEKYLTQNINDIKKAQEEVFGHQLQPGEFDRMTPDKQQKASDKMMTLIQKWREDRRAKELARAGKR